MFNELCRCCFWRWDFVISLWRSSYCLGKSLGYFGISRGPLVNNSVEWNLVSALEAAFDDERWSTGFHLPHCLQTSLGSSLHIIGSFHCTGLPYHSSNALQVYSLPSFSPSILFPLNLPNWSHCPHPPPRLQFTHKIISISTYQEEPCAPPTYQSLLLCLISLVWIGAWLSFT